MEKVRLNIEISKDLDHILEDIARNEGVTKTEIVRRGLSVIKAFKDQVKVGRDHIGFTSDASKLDAEMLGILTAIAQSQSQVAVD